MVARQVTVPVDVAQAARAAATSADGVDADRLRDLGSRLPVGATTLLALIASGVDGRVRQWAEGLYSRSVTAPGRVVDIPDGRARFGVLAPDADDMIVTAVIAASGEGVCRWDGAGWAPISEDAEPAGLTVVELSGDLLTDAMDTTARNGGLLLRAGEPKTWLRKGAPTPVTAGAALHAGVYAVCDDVDTTAVLDVFRVADDDMSAVRAGGVWVPDVDDAVGVLTASGAPIVPIPPGEVRNVVRAVDDHDAVYLTLIADVGPADDMDVEDVEDVEDEGIMVALPVPADLANQLAVPDGLAPDDMHVTVAYLGHTRDCPLDVNELSNLVEEWAGQWEPFTGELSGPGLFAGTGNEDAPVSVALVDAAPLPEMRQTLVDHLESHGVPVVQNHGYTPHVTVGYGLPDQPPVPAGTPFPAEGVGLWYGTERRDFPFSGSPASVTAGFDPGEQRDATGKWSAGGGSGSGGGKSKSGKAGSGPTPGPASLGKNQKFAGFQTDANGNITGILQNAKGGGGSGKGAANKAAAARKKIHDAKVAALKKAAAAAAKAERQVEKDKQQAYAAKTANENAAEQQRRTAATARIAALPQTQQAAASKAEAGRRATWQAKATATASVERKRRTAAALKLTASGKKRAAKLARDIAAVPASALVAADTPAHTATPSALRDYWVAGKGVAKVRWGTHGSYDRCVRELAKYVNPAQVHGQCANLYKLATGTWPGKHGDGKGDASHG